jgi:peroxiredoxin/glutaredoxin
MSRFTSREGQRVPEVTFRTRTATGWRDVSTAELFADQTVIVFSLPGAFTPTCSTSHVPRYEELFDTFKAHGVDRILCMSVNDAFVMNAWKEDQGADRVEFIPDGNGEFTEGMGMLVDKAQLGFGKRSWRYSMVVKDGVVQKMFIEPDVEGDPYDVSDADTMLKYLAPNARTAPDILLFTKPFCGHCTRAKSALAEAGLAYEEVVSTPRMLRAVSSSATTPRVFVDGNLIGGADELATWLQKR